jgi:Protein of unknown function (DUF3761)
MKKLSWLMIVGSFASAAALAEVPAGAPAGSTGLCKDGSYTSNATKQGACAGHKGVKQWFAGSATTTTAAVAKAKEPAVPTAPAASTSAPMAAAPLKAKQAAPANMASAAGGEAGQVWVNSDSKVYHCPGTKYYGKTKQGQYMTEAAAIAAGDRPDHGKGCSGK